MKRRWKIAVATAALVAIAATVVMTTGNDEPTYQGRKLSEWVRDLTASHSGPVFGTRETVFSAVTSMGTNAMPWLVKWATYETPRFPFSHLYRLPVARDQFYRRKRLQIGAYETIIHLQTNAAPAIPFIVQKLKEVPPLKSAQNLGHALPLMGPPGGIALSDCITNRNIPNDTRLILIDIAEMRYRNSREPERWYIYAALTNCLADPSPEIRQTAKSSLQNVSEIRQPVEGSLRPFIYRRE